MRNLMFALAVLMIAGVAGCSQTAMAGNIASDVSGVYVGSDRACRLVLRNHPTVFGSKIVELNCLKFDGWQTAAANTLWAPNDCAGQGAIWINPSSGRPPEYLSIRTYGPQGMWIIRGTNQSLVAGGIGIGETWQRIGNAPSPSSFGCPASSWLYKLPG